MSHEKPNSDHEVIAVIFATMNRRDIALSCLQSITNQTLTPDLVVIADNCSTDGTVGYLKSQVNLPFRLIVHEMVENRGNAGGAQVAMDIAFSLGADAVWILDDDSWPRADALKALVQGGIDQTVVRHALQIDPKSKSFTWPLQVYSRSCGWHLVFCEATLPEGDKILSRICWTGALLPRYVREVVGPVNGNLFIRGEDEEYPWRIEKAGFKQEAVRLAILDHPGPDDVIHYQLFGKNFFYERGLADWKYYYKVRNMVWFKRFKSGLFKALITAFTYSIFTCIFDSLTRLPLLKRAVCDGLSSRLGKAIDLP
jgi:rhamnopyranosyl-N-acetylglucosaminyl-diphospho-decaprenol beta-1,3/1,4-galactofuranosyltransferase